MVTEYIITFKGKLNYTFNFNVQNDWESHDFDQYVYVKDDALYIQRTRITSNQDAIREIFRNLNDKETSIDDKKRVVECIFSIDYSGYVICLKSTQYSSRAERFIAKVFGS